jgi:hypothetical protein
VEDWKIGRLEDWKSGSHPGRDRLRRFSVSEGWKDGKCEAKMKRLVVFLFLVSSLYVFAEPNPTTVRADRKEMVATNTLRRVQHFEDLRGSMRRRVAAEPSGGDPGFTGSGKGILRKMSG